MTIAVLTSPPFSLRLPCSTFFGPCEDAVDADPLQTLCVSGAINCSFCTTSMPTEMVAT
jgi:hypothetical protein